MNKNNITLDNVGFTYNKEPILVNIQASLTKGQIIGIVGPNGSGKTTLINLLCGTLSPNIGSISIFGRSPNQFRQEQKIGYLAQHAAQTIEQFPFSVYEILSSAAYGKSFIRFRGDESIQNTITSLARLVDITAIMNRNLYDLSGGEKQRVLLARALINKPSLLILDEPTTGIDVKHQDEMHALINSIRDKFNTTIIYVTHDIEYISSFADIVLCLNKTIVCRFEKGTFDKKKFIDTMYEHAAYVEHHHHHSL